MPENSHKLAAIVFTDIVGYTKQMEEDEKRAMNLLQKQHDIISPIVKSFNGEIIKELGDGMLMMFSSAVDAVNCAVSIQLRLIDEDLTIRAGIHIGEVIFKEGDVFGSAVNAAARIQALAPPNGVCISEAVKHEIRNQTDIRVHSTGIKELKGIKEPMEIYEVVIEGVTKLKKNGIGKLFNELRARKVIQVLAIYFVGAFLVRMAVDSYVTSKLLSPHLVDLTWVILLSLIPTVILLTYFHGHRTSGKWAKAELIGFPANAVFSILLVIFLFKGKDLGAATTKISYEDDNGVMTEKTIMKNEFRKKVLVFCFENKTADTSFDWIQYAMPRLIEYDASQDIFWDVTGAEDYFDKIKNEGYNDGIVTSLMLNKKIAGNAHKKNFLTGSFNYSGGVYMMQTRLYNTNNGKLLAENEFSGDNLFTLVDDMTLKLKKNLEIPAGHIEETTDMPVAEISTSSFEAMEYFIKGIVQAVLKYDRPQAINLLELAIEKDKNFILPYISLGNLYRQVNQPESALKALQVFMDNRNKLPERWQYIGKIYYYTLKQDPDMVLNLCKKWVELYPDDLNPHSALAYCYFLKNEVNKAIAEYKTILEIDPEEYNFLMILGYQYARLAKYDSAEYYYKQYLQQFPNEVQPYLYLGGLYQQQCDFETAEKIYKEALVLEPENINIMLSLASLSLSEGKITDALSYYDNALKASKFPSDSGVVYSAMTEYYDFLGQMSKSLEYSIKSLEESAKVDTPLETILNSSKNIKRYILAGKQDEAWKIIKIAEKILKPPYDKSIAWSYLNYYTELGNADEAEKYISDAMEDIKAGGIDIAIQAIYRAEGIIAEIRGDYNSALQSYTKFAKMNPGVYEPLQWISRCQRELGNLKEAKKNIEQALKLGPYDPKNNYEAAMLYLKLKDEDKALEHLNRALEVWKDADSTYKPYQQALEAKKQLENIENVLTH